MKREVIVFLCATALLVACGGEKKSGGVAASKDTLVIAFDGTELRVARMDIGGPEHSWATGAAIGAALRGER